MYARICMYAPCPRWGLSWCPSPSSFRIVFYITVQQLSLHLLLQKYKDRSIIVNNIFKWAFLFRHPYFSISPLVSYLSILTSYIFILHLFTSVLLQDLAFPRTILRWIMGPLLPLNFFSDVLVHNHAYVRVPFYFIQLDVICMYARVCMYAHRSSLNNFISYLKFYNTKKYRLQTMTDILYEG